MSSPAEDSHPCLQGLAKPIRFGQTKGKGMSLLKAMLLSHAQTTVTMRSLSPWQRSLKIVIVQFTNAKATLFHQPEEWSLVWETPITRDWSYSAPTWFHTLSSAPDACMYMGSPPAWSQWNSHIYAHATRSRICLGDILVFEQLLLRLGLKHSLFAFPLFWNARFDLNSM